MSRTVVALLACLLLPMGTATSKDAPPAEKQEPNDPWPQDFREKVNKAVDKGVAYLRGHQLPSGLWQHPEALAPFELGYSALMTLALLHGGVRPEDEIIERAMDAMRTMPLQKTYDVATVVLMLHARYVGTKDPWSEALPEEGKDPPEEAAACLERFSKADRNWMQSCVNFLLKSEREGHWRYPEDGADLSNTQFALLALSAAARCGIKIPDEVWLRALEWVLTGQDATGRPVELVVNEVRGAYRVTWMESARARGFRYMAGHTITGSMTTAGMAALAICQERLWGSRKLKPPQRQALRRALRDAMAWMQDNFDVTKNPGSTEPEHHHLYYLYGMERAGMMARFRFMGKFDWYFEGAGWLLSAQRANGCWDVYDALRDTAFGVLFLRRSAGHLDRPVLTGN